MIPRFAACGAILAMVPACFAADLYTVAGTVINAQTGVALRHAQIYMFQPGGRRPRSPLITGDDGRFRLELPAGAYALFAGTRTVSQGYGAGNPDNPFGSAVIVGAGQDTSNLTFRWLPPAAISGRVVDDSSEPVEGALVQLLLSHVMGGRRITRTMAWGRTDDRGEYRFGGIPGGGRYYLAITGKPWYALDDLGVQPQRQETTHPAAFIPVYYPNTADPSRAAPLLVKPGEEARADFTLTQAVGANVSVTHTGPADLKGLVSLKLDGFGGNDSFQEQQNLLATPGGGPQMPQRLVGVPPGRYVVQITGASGEADFSGRTTIEVNGSDLTVEVPLRPTAKLTGKVGFSGTARPAGPLRAARPAGPLRAALSPEGGAGPSVFTVVGPDGSFVFPSVQTGKYRIGFIGAAGFFVTRSAGTDSGLRDGLLNISEGDSATISLTLSDEVGGLKGLVVNGDQPAQAVMAVLAPVEESPNPVRYHGYQTESDGSFEFKNIPAGRYYLFAVEDTAFEFANPAEIKPYLANAKLVTIESHGSSTERIAVAAVKTQ